jgi:hypothetical protein
VDQVWGEEISARLLTREKAAYDAVGDQRFRQDRMFSHEINETHEKILINRLQERGTHFPVNFEGCTACR